MEPVDLEGVAFTWDPKPAQVATDLREAFKVATFHSCGFPGFFKPSIKEVLAQLPQVIPQNIVAFKTETTSDNISDVLTEDGCHHKALTTFYTGTLPEEVRRQPVILGNKPVPYVEEPEDRGLQRDVVVNKPFRFKPSPGK
jgi:hypothetical protein